MLLTEAANQAINRARYDAVLYYRRSTNTIVAIGCDQENDLNFGALRNAPNDFIPLPFDRDLDECTLRFQFAEENDLPYPCEWREHSFLQICRDADMLRAYYAHCDHAYANLVRDWCELHDVSTEVVNAYTA